MYKETDLATASIHYNNGEWVRVGNEEDFWTVNKEFEDGRKLSEIAYRFKQYYDGEVKFYITIK